MLAAADAKLFVSLREAIAPGLLAVFGIVAPDALAALEFKEPAK